ncbi:GNAT family N-acetyltransferase [Photobacterium sp. GJ3]|uniref:GNAT family N-acetyltransferase n=1 Tax=Photobacterium sp. GJ3 TaxID=2829502 RepID=UPI001B8D3F3C|nr:GNAT family N-acetyltransferase [Photobacterium sp. GJ3]QUJ66230.1 GNAT family N-acetyltransferase [Photobacterium sp. GJ3]
MKVTFVRGTDLFFAEHLTKTNMSGYYQTHGIVWDRHQFLCSWDEFDNYEVYDGQIRVGVVRLSYSESTTYLRDLQLVSDVQGKGIGTQCLDIVRHHALKRKSQRLVLRVFRENPAIKLYESKGFTKRSEVNCLIEMELSLASNH